MSDDKKKPLSLDEGDLLSEIDQWGDMFDALHEGDDALTGVRDEVATGVRDVAPPPAQAAAEPIATVSEARAEVDFSDLGIDGPPEALGSLLGTPPPLQPVEEEAARAAEPPRRPSARKIERPTEEEVFTSASRASVAALPAAPTDDELFGDLLADANDERRIEAVTPRIAMPAAPVVQVPAKAPRTSGAIVRREDLGKKKENEFAGGESTRVADLGELDALRAEPGELNDFDDGPRGGAESTRVADLGELEAHSRRAARRSSAPPYAGTPRATTPNVTRRGAPRARWSACPASASPGSACRPRPR